MVEFPRILFHHCQKHQTLLDKLGAKWTSQQVSSLQDFDGFRASRGSVVVVADWDPESAFAKWSRDNADFSIFAVLGTQPWSPPEHVADWLRPDMSAGELDVRLRTGHLRWQERLADKKQVADLEKKNLAQTQMTDRLLQTSLELKRTKEEVEKLSLTDTLTKLSNRRFFDTQLARDIMQSNRYHTPLSMYFLDIDDFKLVNDTYGHQVGDETLQNMGTLIRKNLRETDWAARYGGEEFCVILPMVGLTGSLSSAKRLKDLIEHNLSVIKDKVLTASIGVSTFNPESMQRDDLVRYSDQALYHSKRTGKNKVIYYDERNNGYQEFKS